MRCPPRSAIVLAPLPIHRSDAIARTPAPRTLPSTPAAGRRVPPPRAPPAVFSPLPRAAARPHQSFDVPLPLVRQSPHRTAPSPSATAPRSPRPAAAATSPIPSTPQAAVGDPRAALTLLPTACPPARASTLPAAASVAS